MHAIRVIRRWLMGQRVGALQLSNFALDPPSHWRRDVWTALVCTVRRLEPQVCPCCLASHPKGRNCPCCGCPPAITDVLKQQLLVQSLDERAKD